MKCRSGLPTRVLPSRCLAEAGAASAEGRLKDDLDRLGGEGHRQRSEHADLGDLVLFGSVVPPREVADLAHVDVRGRALRGLVTDRAEESQTRRNDARRVPELALSDLEDRLASLASARREVPTGSVGLADPHGQLAVERDDHRELCRRGWVLAEGVVTPGNE